MFKPGDEAWVLLELDSSNEVIFANMVDYYRIDQQIFLIGLFVILIIAFSGFTEFGHCCRFPLLYLDCEDFNSMSAKRNPSIISCLNGWKFIDSYNLAISRRLQ